MTTPLYTQIYPASSSSTPPEPQPSALPPLTDRTPQAPPDGGAISPSQGREPPSQSPSEVLLRRKVLTRLSIHDLWTVGSRRFLDWRSASHILDDAQYIVLRHLYSLPDAPIPPTRSVTLVLRAMSGVAYTKGIELDSDHKEIHFNTSYIASIPKDRVEREMAGVITHEMVHCWQHNARGTAPGGLIEGIADWVRLKAGYGPPHWKRRADCDWDAGYERTAYFLEWLEERYGAAIVPTINMCLRDCDYDEDKFWHDCCGQSVGELWKDYQKCVEEGGNSDGQ